MPKFQLIKKGNVYHPANVEAQISSRKISQGEIIQGKSVDQRNAKFNSKYWTMATFVAHNIPESQNDILFHNHEFKIKNKEDFHWYVKVKKGYIEKKFIDKKGNIGWETKSIAFGKMDDVEFDKFYNDALDIACTLLSVENDDLVKELINWM